MIQLSAAAAASQSRMCASASTVAMYAAVASRTVRAIGAQAQHHGRVHRVGHAVFAEQPRAAARRNASGIHPTAARCARFPPSVPGSARSVRPVARAFMGHCERRIENPACISAHAARATARAARSAGQPRPASSQTYSQIASESHTSSGAVLQHRHALRGADGGDVAREFRRVERQHALGEREPHVLHEHPRAQRPR